MKIALIAAALALPAAAHAQDHSLHDMPGMAADPHAGHDMGGQPSVGQIVADGMAAHAEPPHSMAALGAYPAGREASGTAWAPDTTPAQHGAMTMRGDWMLMGHATLYGVLDRQSGPRGDDKAFAAGMVMGMAQRPLGDGKLQLRAMLSPDPLMGKRGYPLLLATGETADGKTPLVDRQHPHDAFMELSASISQPVGRDASVFLYGGLPGEPAFGPPAFMHRLSIMDSPEAPISHHWLDSTHITFGVVTAGLVYKNIKLEASRFRGREPDQNRYDIETGALDSTAVRLSWNPASRLSLQVSGAELTSPEGLDPDEDQRKWSASAIYTHPLADGRWWSTTAAWGRRGGGHHGWFDAYVLESAIVPAKDWTVFARAEQTENNELTGAHSRAYTVSKASVGAIRDFTVTPYAKVGVGALYSVNRLPSALKPLYGDADGAMAFVRLKIGG